MSQRELCVHLYTDNAVKLCVSSLVFVYVRSTHVCMGVAALVAGSCLSSPDQRSATQLSHLVRHSICSVLQKWCEVQARLTTLDLPVWAACEPRGEWQGQAEKWQPTQGSRSQRAMKRVTGMEKTQEGWRRITRREDNFSGQRWRLSHALLLRLCVFLSSTPGSPLLYPHTLLCSHFLPVSPSLSLSVARSTALLASGNAVCSPLSLCDGGMACGVKGRWSDGGLQRRKTHPLSLFCWPWTWTQLIIYCVYVNLQNVIVDVLVILKGQLTRIAKRHMASVILPWIYYYHLINNIIFCLYFCLYWDFICDRHRNFN